MIKQEELIAIPDNELYMLYQLVSQLDQNTLTISSEVWKAHLEEKEMITSECKKRGLI